MGLIPEYLFYKCMLNESGWGWGAVGRGQMARPLDTRGMTYAQLQGLAPAPLSGAEPQC